MNINPIYHQSKKNIVDELTLITNAKKDPERFGPLYEKYHAQIFRYVYQRMDDQELAFDVTSQVFIKALSNIHKYEYRGVPFASWLYRIAKSELYQAFRDRKARKTVNVENMHIFEMIEEFEEDDSQANKKKLIDCLASMKQKDMELLELRYFEKRSYREIGQILEIPENTAKVRAFRALDKLKKLFLN